jgi:hypothetical protein
MRAKEAESTLEIVHSLLQIGGLPIMLLATNLAANTDQSQDIR